MTTNQPTPVILSDEALEEIEARANLATPGPLGARLGSGHNVCTALASVGSDAFDEFVCDVLPDYACKEGCAPRWEANRDFIEHAYADIPALCQTVRALRDDPRRVWDEHPNRDGSGKKCTECGFDNRFHAYKCFFHHPSLKISEEAFNAIHDEKMAAEKENTALREQLAQARRERDAYHNQVVELQSRLAQVEKERNALRDSASLVAFQAHQIDGRTATSLMNSARKQCVSKVREYLTDCRDEETGIIEAVALQLESLIEKEQP